MSGTLSGTGTVGALKTTGGALARGTNIGTLNAGNTDFGGGTFAIEIASAEKTKELLADTIAQGALGRAFPKTPRNEQRIAAAILVFWSVMHGLTLLLVDRLVGPSRKSDKLTESVLRSMLEGLAKKIPDLPPGTWVGPRAPVKKKAYESPPNATRA